MYSVIVQVTSSLKCVVLINQSLLVLSDQLKTHDEVQFLTIKSGVPVSRVNPKVRKRIFHPAAEHRAPTITPPHWKEIPPPPLLLAGTHSSLNPALVMRSFHIIIFSLPFFLFELIEIWPVTGTTLCGWSLCLIRCFLYWTIND